MPGFKTLSPEVLTGIFILVHSIENLFIRIIIALMVTRCFACTH